MAEIKLEPQQEPARLRIYIGAAPGVGKTYHMLNDAYMAFHQDKLDIVIGLVESLGGQIAVESRLGHGTTFRFTIPVAVLGEVRHPVEVG